MPQQEILRAGERGVLVSFVGEFGTREAAQRNLLAFDSGCGGPARPPRFGGGRLKTSMLSVSGWSTSRK